MSNPERRATNRFRLLLRLLPPEFRGDFGPRWSKSSLPSAKKPRAEGGPRWASGVSGGNRQKEFSPHRSRASTSHAAPGLPFALRMMRKTSASPRRDNRLGLGIGANTAS